MKKTKILYDISHAVHGNTGIQQDMRWTLSAILDSAKFDVDLLLYDMTMIPEVIFFDEKKAISDNNQQIAAAQLLSAFCGTSSNFNWGNGITKLLTKFRYKNLLYKKNRYYQVKIDRKYNEIIYKKYLASGLEPRYLDKIKSCNVILSNFSSEFLVQRLRNEKYSLPFFDTHEYDIAIFQQELPIRISQNTKKILRHYDLIQVNSPDVVHEANIKIPYQYKSIVNCAKQNSTFCAISKQAIEELKKCFTDITLKTEYIPCTIYGGFHPIKNLEVLKSIFFKYSKKTLKLNSISKLNYILNVGTVEPRKNLKTLIKAYRLLRSTKGQLSNLKLVLVSSHTFLNSNFFSQYKSDIENEDIIILNGVETDELSYLYSHAKCFVYPSFMEGFGLPPIEAMACGCPVVSSDIEVHREIQGVAALYANPYDVNDFVEKITQVLTSKEVAEQMSELGIKQADQYSSQNNLKRWVSFLENVLVEANI